MKETAKGTDLEAIKADTEALQQKFYKLSEKLYAQQQAQGGAAGADPTGANPGANEDGTINTDFEDKTGE